MTDELITDLAKISALRVISRSSVMQFKGEHRKVMPEIARELNVDAVVEGSVLRTGDKVRITAQLIDAPDDRHLWADSFERDSRDVLALQDDLASAIASEINVQLTAEEQARSAKARSVDPTAYDAYLRGRYQLGKFTEQGSAHALQLFQQAIASDPKFAPAYAGIAEVYWTECSWTVSCAKAMAKAREAAAKAVELGGTSAESHYTLGLVYMLAFDWANAEREYRKALSLNPGFVDAHRYYGYWLMAQGKLVEAVGEFRKAQQLDPLSANLATEESFALRYDHKYEEAAEAIRRALYLDPNSWEPHVALVALDFENGKPAEAIGEGHKALALEDSPTTKTWLAYAYAASGDRRNAQSLLGEMMKISGQRYVDPALVGIVHLGLGEKDRALEDLEAGYADHSGMLWMLKVDHIYDPLRSDPRFVELLKKVGLDK
jgi:Tfp pilus assembly protein PilF